MLAVQVERVELVQGDGHQRVECWRYGHVGGHDARHVTLGTLPDGRWYVQGVGQGIHADAFPDEPAARAYLAGLIAGPGWYEWPANFDARHRPLPPGAWVRHGGLWARDVTGH